jgi:hypothetical protein
MFRLQVAEKCGDYKNRSRVGKSMSTIEMVVFCLVLVWAPGLAFVGYLLLPRRPEID